MLLHASRHQMTHGGHFESNLDHASSKCLSSLGNIWKASKLKEISVAGTAQVTPEIIAAKEHSFSQAWRQLVLKHQWTEQSCLLRTHFFHLWALGIWTNSNARWILIQYLTGLSSVGWVASFHHGFLKAADLSFSCRLEPTGPPQRLQCLNHSVSFPRQHFSKHARLVSQPRRAHAHLHQKMQCLQ